jgi:hypothetical protein
MPISINSNFSKGENKIFEFTVKGDPEFLSPIFSKINLEWQKTEILGEIEILEDRGSVTAKYVVPEPAGDKGAKFFDFFSNIYEISKM